MFAPELRQQQLQHPLPTTSQGSDSSQQCSPVAAASAPQSQEAAQPHSQSHAVCANFDDTADEQFFLFTTDMANEADLQVQLRNFDSIVAWHRLNGDAWLRNGGKTTKKDTVADDTVVGSAGTTVVDGSEVEEGTVEEANATGKKKRRREEERAEDTEERGEEKRRRLSPSPSDVDDEGKKLTNDISTVAEYTSPPAMAFSAPQSSISPFPVRSPSLASTSNPLKQMEKMTASPVFESNEMKEFVHCTTAVKSSRTLRTSSIEDLSRQQVYSPAQLTPPPFAMMSPHYPPMLPYPSPSYLPYSVPYPMTAPPQYPSHLSPAYLPHTASPLASPSHPYPPLPYPQMVAPPSVPYPVGPPTMMSPYYPPYLPYMMAPPSYAPPQAAPPGR